MKIVPMPGNVSGAPLQVILGSQTIKAFVACPRAFKVIGIVRFGMEFGLLTRTVGGNYMRVNGSRFEPLDSAAVEFAMSVACACGRGESYAATRQQRGQAAAAARVVVRRRGRSRAGGTAILDTRSRTGVSAY